MLIRPHQCGTAQQAKRLRPRMTDSHSRRAAAAELAVPSARSRSGAAAHSFATSPIESDKPKAPDVPDVNCCAEQTCRMMCIT